RIFLLQIVNKKQQIQRVAGAQENEFRRSQKQFRQDAEHHTFLTERRLRLVIRRYAVIVAACYFQVKSKVALLLLRSCSGIILSGTGRKLVRVLGPELRNTAWKIKEKNLRFLAGVECSICRFFLR